MRIHGIEAEPQKQRLVLRFNLDSRQWSKAVECLQGILAAAEDLGFHFTNSPRDKGENTIVWGYSRRFIHGVWNEDIPAVEDDYWSRWNRRAPRPPLRIPSLKRDTEYPAFRKAGAVAALERDIVLILESDTREALRVLHEFVSLNTGITDLVCIEGASFTQGRDPFGNCDGISNLQDLRAHEIERYKEIVYRKDPVPGTDYVFRRYRLNKDRFPEPGDVLSYQSSRNGRIREFKGPEGVIGREVTTGLVVNHYDGSLMAPDYDQRQAIHACPGTHVRMANPRGHGYTSFNSQVVVAPTRILRRSFRTFDDDLVFQGFQADVGAAFEFIHNDWLMSDFNGHPDPLLDPDAMLVEPIDVAYFFCPVNQDPQSV